ncbi:prepilin peptidase [Paenibacillus bovis]|uniref:Prepilin peptidase n=1 Tax=Paenibacillus bovis TaxID=1616788 RepID=A0A172ZEE2_9BACL|nr:A24 family peptidase [Paenibacillus bovis]ANF95742.1 prepilin peptidase [Paenibacillus bovis]
MTILIGIYVLILGLVLGSFYNVVALRVPAGESVIHPPSRCPHCGTRLTGTDMVPVFSYLWSRGRCRHCQAPVSVWYPIGEALTGLMFLWMYLEYGFTAQAITGMVLVSLSVIITVADIYYMKIPNRVLLFFLPVLLVLVLLFPVTSLWSHLAGGIGAGVILLIAAIASKGGMGMGDIKLFALYGWVLGFPNMLMALFIACLLGLVTGLILRCTGRSGKKQPIPFGPFLAVGTLIAYVYGPVIISGYLSLIV